MANEAEKALLRRQWFVGQRGVGQLDLDLVNLGLWALALLLHGRPDRFLAACDKGIRGCAGIVLQFPLYDRDHGADGRVWALGRAHAGRRRGRVRAARPGHLP
ncbi:MAG: TIGR00366 family protein [Deltaproteobacteria bacterium]|nr:TIGR00366 family protein [Deltaproteobacteria bacterium]